MYGFCIYYIRANVSVIPVPFLSYSQMVQPSNIHSRQREEKREMRYYQQSKQGFGKGGDGEMETDLQYVFVIVWGDNNE